MKFYKVNSNFQLQKADQWLERGEKLKMWMRKPWERVYPGNVLYPDNGSSFGCLHLPVFIELYNFK